VSQRFDLEGRNALVTGASRGLGRHFALTLARAGARVALAARSTDRLAEVAREIEGFGARALPVALDVTDEASVHAAVAAAETELGALHILINNAGLAVTKTVLETSQADWDLVLDTNLKGAFLVAREVARCMARHDHGGKIINIASIGGMIALGQLASYGASKAGLIQLTRSLAAELARYDIQVNAIAPGYVETDMNRAFFATEAGQKLIETEIPQRRLGRPEDLDGALLLLASDASRFITGSVIVVDGGHSLG
jgi:NAD(P)-dependent dehydrogenase (short-subunit alcohol dehydrogenase family)